LTGFFLRVAIDKEEYIANESSDFTIYIEVFSDRYPVLFNSSLNSEYIRVENNQSFAYQIISVSTNLTGNHYIMAIFDEVYVTMPFALRVQCES